MAFLIKLMALVALTSVATAKPTTVRPSLSSQSSQESEESFIPSYALNPPSYESSYQIPTDLQLPKTEQSGIPFYPAELSTVLKAPQYSPEPTYYEVPIPSQDLIAPIQNAWNPNNDPSYFYEVPVVLTKQELPTNGFPKKYNKEIHSKTKPFSSKPKQEITLYPIEEKEVARKQKNLNKVFDSLAKKENQKRIQEQQSQQAVQI